MTGFNFSPAGGTFTIEHAVNRRFTTTIDDPILGEFVDGKDHPDLGISQDGKIPGSECISEPNSRVIQLTMFKTNLFFVVHVQNETMAHGTAFAISYMSDLSKVTPENLVVFTVLYKYVFLQTSCRWFKGMAFKARPGNDLQHIEYPIFLHAPLLVASALLVPRIVLSCSLIDTVIL